MSADFQVTEIDAADADIIKKCVLGITLTQQFQTADWTRKAYLCKNLDRLKKMLKSNFICS